LAGLPRDETAEALRAYGATDIPAGWLPAADAHLIELWPDQVPAVRLFDAMLTQWRIGPSGPVGLDYGVMAWVASRIGLTPDDLADSFEDIRDMEDEALLWCAEQRK
jgi:hypothetical protein